MPITRVDAWTEALPLREPVLRDGQYFGDVPAAFVRLRTDEGPTGMGCALPALDVSAEALKAVGSALATAGEALVGGNDLHRIDLLRTIPKDLQLPFDLALQDLLGQRANLPLHLLRGASSAGLTCSRRVPAMGTRATVDHAKKQAADGARAWHVEAFGDPETDALRLLQLRDQLGPDAGLALHAVGTHADLHALCAEIPTANLSYIVVSPTSPQRLARLAHGLPAPLAVRCDSPTAARTLLATGVSLLHVTLHEAGGLSGLDEIAALTRGHGARLVVGSSPEPALTVAAAMHFALGEPSVAFCELDGHLALEKDPTAGCALWRHGELYPTDRPGLGWARPRKA